MSDYTKATNFTSKDTLPTGNANKIVKGTELDVEFTAIASAISSKANSNDAVLTGAPTAPTASAGTATTQIATTAFVIAERTNTSTLTNKTLTSPTINGGTITGITDLAVADGGTGSSTLAVNNVLLGNGTSALQTVAPGTSGYVLTSNGTTWTSAIAPVASVNGQTGAVVTTNIGSIGGTIIAWYAITSPYPNLSQASSYWQITNTAPNSTVAGSDLRYDITNNLGAPYGNNLQGYSIFDNATQGRSVSGRNSVSWASGGSSLSGSWRSLTGVSVKSLGYSGGKGGAYTDGTWYAGLWVRYA